MRHRAAVIPVCFLLSTLVPLHAADPGVEELLRKHAEARGGAERWRSIESIEWSGMATIFSTPAPFTLVRRRPNLYRFDRIILENPVMSAFDGTTAWWQNAGMGAGWPALMPLPDAEITRREADFDGPLIDPAGKGHAVEALGRGDLDGIEAYELTVTLKDGAEENWFLDPQTFLAVGRIAGDADYGRPMPKTTFYSDYRTVNGLVLPHRIEMEYGTRHEVLAVDKVRVNFDPGETHFKLPPPEGMEPLASLAGEWDLTLETRPFPQAPWKEHLARSTITPRLGGRVLEEQFSYVDDGVPIDVIRTVSFDRFQELYRITQIDSFTALQDVLQGPFADGALTVTDLNSGPVQVGPGSTVHARIALSGVEPGGFLIEVSSSTDGGENWTTSSRCTYVRR